MCYSTFEVTFMQPVLIGEFHLQKVQFKITYSVCNRKKLL